MLTGSPIEIHPTFNPMIGPSPYVLVSSGGRFAPCMHNMHQVTDANTTINWPCPNSTSSDASATVCTLSELCGMGGVPNPRINGSLSDTPAPNQWWRFIVPIFLHAGIIHIGFNLLLQLTLGRDVERMIGSFRFALVYFASGIFGFVLGANISANGIVSTGCSGAIFGLIAINLLNLLYHWQTTKRPFRELAFILVDIVIAFVLGLFPGIDNGAHLGGLMMGLVLGVCLLRSPDAFNKKLGDEDTMYDPANKSRSGTMSFFKAPAQFFSGRKPLWWCWWVVRVAALIGIVVGFVVLLKNFYVWHHTCTNCRYISCLPIRNFCEVGDLAFSQQSNKRDIGALGQAFFDQAEL